MQAAAVPTHGREACCVRCRFVGISRKTATSVAAHVEDLPELAHEVACVILPGAGKGKCVTPSRAPCPALLCRQLFVFVSLP